MKYNLINKIIVKMQPKTIVFAHCDIPCGIYDPKAKVGSNDVFNNFQTINDIAANDKKKMKIKK